MVSHYSAPETCVACALRWTMRLIQLEKGVEKTEALNATIFDGGMCPKCEALARTGVFVIGAKDGLRTGMAVLVPDKTMTEIFPESEDLKLALERRFMILDDSVMEHFGFNRFCLEQAKNINEDKGGEHEDH